MKIALLGFGKMGQLIGQLAATRGHQVVLVIGAENSHDLTIDALQKADVAIEFSAPEVAARHIQLCLEAGVPVVVGTTGWYDVYDELADLAKAKQGALLTATNFSLGVNLFFALSQWMGAAMADHPDYHVRIDETHHVHKKDAPSGTAITIAERLLEHLNLKGWSLNGTIDNSLPVFAHRSDEVPGTHEVRFSSAEDDIVLSHIAHNRNGFASGAVLAAEWLVKKQGVFTMKDVLGL
jgi:4-hydroxy-tetrahydrodipicolinate reductase